MDTDAEKHHELPGLSAFLTASQVNTGELDLLTKLERKIMRLRLFPMVESGRRASG